MPALKKHGLFSAEKKLFSNEILKHLRNGSISKAELKQLNGITPNIEAVKAFYKKVIKDKELALKLEIGRTARLHQKTGFPVSSTKVIPSIARKNIESWFKPVKQQPVKETQKKPVSRIKWTDTRVHDFIEFRKKHRK
ncbi:MAG: hypothetical protein JW703_03790 [Candidatus Diapherotrites archaeon]|nr:hypothetical protein [Candidatus Diapherotrites archaeon]